MELRDEGLSNRFDLSGYFQSSALLSFLKAFCDWTQYIVDEIWDQKHTLVLENLNKLKVRVNGSKRFNKQLSLWAYRRIQSYIHYKALIEEIPVAYVSAKGTSRESPIGGKLVFINYR